MKIVIGVLVVAVIVVLAYIAKKKPCCKPGAKKTCDKPEEKTPPQT